MEKKVTVQFQVVEPDEYHHDFVSMTPAEIILLKSEPFITFKGNKMRVHFDESIWGEDGLERVHVTLRHYD
jgi:hypothetical protein